MRLITSDIIDDKNTQQFTQDFFNINTGGLHKMHMKQKGKSDCLTSFLSSLPNLCLWPFAWFGGAHTIHSSSIAIQNHSIFLTSLLTDWKITLHCVNQTVHSYACTNVLKTHWFLPAKCMLASTQPSVIEGALVCLTEKTTLPNQIPTCSCCCARKVQMCSCFYNRTST